MCGSFLLSVFRFQRFYSGFIDSEDTQILTTHGDDIARALARGVTDYANFLASA